MTHEERARREEGRLLSDVSQAAEKYAAAKDALHVAIREARSAGLTLRVIAHIAGLSPEWVRKIASE